MTFDELLPLAAALAQTLIARKAPGTRIDPSDITDALRVAMQGLEQYQSEREQSAPPRQQQSG